MKIKNIIQASILAGLMGLGYACSNGESELNEIASSAYESRSTEMEATANLETAGTLESVLKEAHGDDVVNITKLTLTGNYNAVDHRFLRDSLTALTELDMEGVTIVGGDSTYRAPNSHDWDYLKDFKLVDNTIGQNMFSHLKLTNLVIPNNVVKIEDYAFTTTKLKSFEIPASVTSMGQGVCNVIKTLEDVKVLANITGLPHSTFGGCENLKKVELSSTINSIGTNAFTNCFSLTDFSYFKNIVFIDKEAFKVCGFTSIDFHEGLVYVGEAAFSGCRSLASVTFSSTMTNVSTNMFTYSAVESLKIPETVTKLSRACFWGMEHLKSIELLASVEHIPWDAFRYTVLEQITLSPTINGIEYDAFNGCKLKDFTPFKNVTSIDNWAFKNNQFTSLDLPEGLVSIGKEAFYGNPLTHVSLPSTLTSIRADAFSSTRLSTLTVPSTVKQIESSFIDNCGNLTSLFWNTSVDLPDASSVNKNCLVYLTNDKVKTNNWRNIILNGYATSIELVGSGTEDYYASSHPFHCPQSFTAKKITFTKEFSLKTSIGGNEGWETIVLPFVPTEYSHAEKGVIAPFDSDIDTKKHFWLRELNNDGFVDVATMEANKPYIISMPNCEEYVADYNLNGTITFGATDVTIAETPSPMEAVSGPEFSLQPVYSKVEESVSVYTLNTRASVKDYERGSVFKRSLAVVVPFEAYAFYTGRSSSSVIGIGKNTGKSRLVGKKNVSGIPQKEDMN